jgi:radical SAM protein with 4Fe4S-binding SPASM domain
VRARPEPFGAWVRLDDATLVAITKRAAERLGVDGGDLWRADAAGTQTARPPLEVHVAVTSRCGAGCRGCYLDASPDGESPPFETIVDRLRAVAEGGAFTVAFGGGEPLSRPDLGDLARAARDLGLTPVVTTSGIGLTPERAAGLRSFAQVNVSYDGEAEAYALVRGFSGARLAERAMQALAGAGVPFGVNIVLTRATLPLLERALLRAEELGAREAQLLRYKPAGRARSPAYLEARLSPAQVDALPALLERVARERSLGLRIDCSMVPLLSAHPVDPARLARFGVLGCEAGRHLAAVRVDGALAPCSFGPPADATAERAWSEATGADHELRASSLPTKTAWEEDRTLAAWRAPHDAEPCASCPLRDVCRGGCRVVALHLEGALGPDPECPRVRAYRAATATPPLAPDVADVAR